jgi:hypothetical protein
MLMPAYLFGRLLIFVNLYISLGLGATRTPKHSVELLMVDVY